MTIGERIDAAIEGVEMHWNRLKYQWLWFWMTPAERIVELDRRDRAKGLLSHTNIARDALAVLHKNLSFVRPLQSSFGETVRVRLPPRYAPMTAQVDAGPIKKVDQITVEGIHASPPKDQ